MIQVNRKRLSRAVWSSLLAQPVDIAHTRPLERLREQAAYNTGTTADASLIALGAVVRAVRPKRVIEIGTFIGKSTAMLAEYGAEVHTCDASNDIRLPAAVGNVTQYHCSSTAMLQTLRGEFDMAYIDGRLQPDDVGLLKRLLTPQAVIALDDFEGLEKGVWNAQQLDLSNRVLVYPPESVPGAQDDSSLALILPGLKFTAQ